MADIHQTYAAFHTTRWSLLDALGAADEKTRRHARSVLVESYWPPVYGWLRRRGHSRSDAAEVTQSFFTDVIISRSLFERADRSKAGLRALLVTSLKNYLIDRQRRRDAGPPIVELSAQHLDVEDLLIESDPDASPESAFDRRWAMVTLENALRRCEQHYADRRSAHHWKAFEIWVLQPSIHGTEPPPRAQLAAELGFTDSASLSAAVHSVRLRLRAILQQLVDEENPDPAEAEVEYRRLLQSLGAARMAD